jgi:hypothetical protein
MTIEKLTDTERHYLGTVGARGTLKALRIIDALTAENERLRAELSAADEYHQAQWGASEARLATAEADNADLVLRYGENTERMILAEARLATAVGLLVEVLPFAKHWRPSTERAVRAFLASAQPAAPAQPRQQDMTEDEYYSYQPAAPACATCKGEGRVIGDCGDSPNMWFDPCPDCQPAAPCEKKASNPSLELSSFADLGLK